MDRQDSYQKGQERNQESQYNQKDDWDNLQGNQKFYEHLCAYF